MGVNMLRLFRFLLPALLPASLAQADARVLDTEGQSCRLPLLFFSFPRSAWECLPGSGGNAPSEIGHLTSGLYSHAERGNEGAGVSFHGS